MELNDTQRDALTSIVNSGTQPVHHKSSAHPGGPHHKTLEALSAKGLITQVKGGGWIAADAGKAALNAAK